jgi:tetratricopeptide (TPR) repeat protein
MLAWLTIALVLGVTVGTRFVPTAEELRAAFEQGQKFYASGAYDQAIERYRQVTRSKSDLLDEKAVKVAVGEVNAPLDEVAWYQIGNAFFKMAEEKLERSTSNREERDRTAATVAADSLFGVAAGYFLKTEEVASGAELRVLARSRVLTCRYRMRDFAGTVEEARLLLARYPQSGHAEQAMYDIGWSYYDMEEYGQSVTAFEALVERFPGGYRANRALFQIGEAHFAMEDFSAAIAYYRRLVESQGLERMSEREVLQMKREKLAGLVDETALDLAAKALIRIGVCYEQIGEYEQAAEAFERIATQFADERRLVEEAYRRQADMYYGQDDFQSCIDVYRRAVVSQQDVSGRARMQLLLAHRYFETDHFEEAVEEYNAYRYSYPELASRVGLPLEGAGLQIARAWFGRAENGGSDEARDHYRQAELELRRTLAAFPGSTFDDELWFNLGLAVQLQGGEEKLAEALKVFAEVRELVGEIGFGRSALFQTARIHRQQEEFARAADGYRQLIEELGDAAEGGVARFELGVTEQAAGARERALAAFLAVHPVSVLYSRSRLEAGQVLAQQGAREQAIEVFTEGLDAAGDGEEEALFHYLLAATQAQLGNQSEALAHFERAAAGAGPELKERALYGRGVAAFKLERYGEAVAYLDREWEDVEIASAALRLLAAAHASLGQANEAMAIYGELAGGGVPAAEQAEYRLALAEIAYRQGEYDRAVAACEELLLLDFAEEPPGAVRPYFVREKAHFLIADARTREEDFASAREAAQAGLKRFAKAFYAPDFLFLDGLAALQLDLNDEAAGSLRELLLRFPEHENAPYARYYLAYAFFNRTLFEPALEEFQRVVELTPDLDIAPDALFRIAECYFNLERFGEAGEAYRRVREQFADSPLREDALYNIAWCALNGLPPGEEMPDMSPVEIAFSAYLEEYPQGKYVAMAQYTLAEIRFNEEDFDRAYDLFSRIERDFPESAAAAQAGRFMPRLLEAIAYREYAVMLEDFNRGLEEENDELLRKMIPKFESLWSQYPETASGVGAKLNIGVCYQNLKEWQAAVETFETIITAGEKGNEQVTPQVLGFAERRRNMIARKFL